MSEAQTPQGIDQPEPNLPATDDRIAHVESSADARDAIATPTDQKSLSPVAEHQPDSQLAAQVIDFLGSLYEEDLKDDLIDEALAWESDTDVAELVNLSEAMQDQNRELITHVEQLETLLDECHNALQAQIERSQTAETTLIQQNKELQTTQEQLTRVFRELESSQQIAQRQQIIIETLTQQLESSQERVAELERQCAFTQQRYNEQTHLLLQKETNCQELQDRLQRQQRYTLQFKAALDKCLEMPGINKIPTQRSTRVAEAKTELNQQQPLIFSPQPIQPWSIEPELGSENIEFDAREMPPVLSESANANNPIPQTETKPDTASFANPFFNAPAPEIQLESEQPIESATDSEVNISEAEQVLWQELERLTQDAVELRNTTQRENPVTAEAKISSPPFIADRDVNLEKKENPSQQESKVPSRASGIAPSASTEEQHPNSPSPLVYPQRTPKKIKSLAAIDLPTFPRLK